MPQLLDAFDGFWQPQYLPDRWQLAAAQYLVTEHDFQRGDPATSPSCQQAPRLGGNAKLGTDSMPAAICRRMPGAQIVAMGVLPKGQTWPNTCTAAITQANARLQEYAERHKPWLHYIDIGDRFLTHQVCLGGHA